MPQLEAVLAPLAGLLVAALFVLRLGDRRADRGLACRSHPAPRR